MRSFAPAAVAAFACFASSAAAGPRSEAIEMLAGIESSWDALGFEVWLNEARGEALERAANRVSLGALHEVRTAGAPGAHLLLVHVDPHGVATVAAARADAAGADRTIASEAATPPIGREENIARVAIVEVDLACELPRRSTARCGKGARTGWIEVDGRWTLAGASWAWSTR